jgi:hypothetical protein
MVDHQTIKEVLLEIPFKYRPRYYKDAKSGDSQPLDIRLRRKHITYAPDVYWVNKTEKIIIFEIAFNEDQRSIVGELTLASLVPNAWKFFVIVNNEKWASEINNFISIVDEQLLDEKGKRRMRFKSEVICIPEKLKRRTEVEKFLVEKLEPGGWL